MANSRTRRLPPSILIGFVQVTVVLAAAAFLFHVPMVGSMLLLCALVLWPLAAALAVAGTLALLRFRQTLD